jgi:hypothetical protein
MGFMRPDLLAPGNLAVVAGEQLFMEQGPPTR